MEASYTLNWSDDTLKTPFLLGHGITDSWSTSLNLSGVGVFSGEPVQEDLLALLEHFASGVPPLNPTIGQLWFDTSNNKLLLYTVRRAWADVTTSLLPHV